MSWLTIIFVCRCLCDISFHFWCQVMVPGLQAMDVDNGDGNVIKVITDENTNHLISDEMLASEPAVHHAPQPAGVLRARGELPGRRHHLLRRGQQGECDMDSLSLVRRTNSSPLIGWYPWLSPNAVPSQALLRRMFGENQVGEWYIDTRMESYLKFSTQSQRPVTTKSPVKTSVTLVRSFGHTR